MLYNKLMVFQLNGFTAFFQIISYPKTIRTFGRVKKDILLEVKKDVFMGAKLGRENGCKTGGCKNRRENEYKN